MIIFRKLKGENKKHPLRKVTNRYQNVEGRLSEVLECGHHIIAEFYEKGEKVYLTEVKKRRCKECYSNKETEYEQLNQLNKILSEYTKENGYNKCPCCGAKLTGEVLKDDSSFFVVCPKCKYDINLWKVEPFYSEHMENLRKNLN